MQGQEVVIDVAKCFNEAIGNELLPTGQVSL